MNEEERNTVENLTYKPFQFEVYHDWIAETAVDVLDVLDKVTNAQGFQVRIETRFQREEFLFFQENFQFLWNKIIRSETSQHLLIDAFWWFYLKYFVVEYQRERKTFIETNRFVLFLKKMENGDEQAEKYLNRIAKNYVELLLSVDPWFRDKFFKVSLFRRVKICLSDRSIDLILRSDLRFVLGSSSLSSVLGHLS